MIHMIHDILGDEPVLGIYGNKSDLFVREQVKEETIKKYSEDKKIPFKLTSAKNPLTFNKNHNLKNRTFKFEN